MSDLTTKIQTVLASSLEFDNEQDAGNSSFSFMKFTQDGQSIIARVGCFAYEPNTKTPISKQLTANGLQNMCIPKIDNCVVLLPLAGQNIWLSKKTGEEQILTSGDEVVLTSLSFELNEYFERQTKTNVDFSMRVYKITRKSQMLSLGAKNGMINFTVAFKDLDIMEIME
jgi:hypothetical protein